MFTQFISDLAPLAILSLGLLLPIVALYPKYKHLLGSNKPSGLFPILKSGISVFLMLALTFQSLSILGFLPSTDIKAYAADPAACTAGGTVNTDHNSDPACAGKVQYRVIYKSIDCVNNTADFEVQVKSDSAFPQPIMGDYNIRIEYNSTTMTRIGAGLGTLVSQNKYSNQAPSANTAYLAQNLNGSVQNATSGILSINGFYGSSQAGDLIPTTFTTLSTIRMNIVSPTASLNMDMKNATIDFPVTGNNVVLDDGIGGYDLITPAYETANIDLTGSSKNTLCPTGLTATDDNYTTNGTTPVTLTPLTGDTAGTTIKSINGVDLIPGTAQTITVPIGTVNVSATGVITFTANSANGSTTFPYVIQNSSGQTATANQTINLNQIPKAVPDSFLTPVGTPKIIDIIANDYDTTPNGPLTLTKIGTTVIVPGTTQNITVTNGSVNVSPIGVVTFTPNPGYTGIVTFPYTIKDSMGLTSSSTVVVKMDNATDPCISGISSISDYDIIFQDNQGLNRFFGNSLIFFVGNLSYITAPGFSTLPTAPPAGLSSAFASAPTISGDVLPLVGTGAKWFYKEVPTQYSSGHTIKWYYYVAYNGGGLTDEIHYKILAWSQLDNASPVLNPQDYQYNSYDGATALGGYNFYQPLSYSVGACAPTIAAVDDNYTATGTTPVTLTPLTGDTAGTTIKSINGVDRTPGIAQTITVTNGTVTIATNGVIKFTANAGFVGDATFPYIIQDSTGNTAAANEKITVSAAALPIAKDDVYTTYNTSTTRGTKLISPITGNGGYLAVGGVPTPTAGKDTTSNGRIKLLSINGVTITNTQTNPGPVQIIPVPNGTIEVSAQGDFLNFKSNIGYTGTTTFPYIIQDTAGGTATANEIITVINAPCGVQTLTLADWYTYPDTGSGGSNTYSIDGPFVQSNSPTPPPASQFVGAPLISSLVGGVDNALNAGYPIANTNVWVQSSEQFNGNTITSYTSFIPNADASIGDYFVANYYTINNGPFLVGDYGGGGSGTGKHDSYSLTLPLACPTATDDNYTTTGTTPVTLTPLTGDTAGTTIKSINGVAITPGTAQTIPVTNGTVNISSTGVITFTANTGYTGLASFPYVIQDTSGQTASANEIINILPKTGDVCTNKIINGAFTTDLSSWTAGTGWIWNNGTAALATDSLTNNKISQSIVGYTNSAGTVTYRIELQPAEANNLTTFGADLDVSFGGTKYLTISNPIGTGDVTYTTANGSIYTADTVIRNQLATIYLTVPNAGTAPKVLEFNHVSGDDDWYIYNVATDYCVTPPTAVDDNYTATGTTPITLTPLTGDTAGTTIKSINGVAITPGTAQTIPVTNGTVTIDTAGVITFTANPGFTGQVTFPYVIENSQGTTATANEIIVVNGVSSSSSSLSSSLSSSSSNSSSSSSISSSSSSSSSLSSSSNISSSSSSSSSVSSNSNSSSFSSSSSSNSSAVFVANPKLELDKASTYNDVNNNNAGDVGETISYTFTIKNTGNVPLINITISDANAVISGGPLASLAVGATDTTTFTGIHTITAADIIAFKVTNTATVSGTPPNKPDGTPNTPVTDSSNDPKTVPADPNNPNDPKANDPTVTLIPPYVTEDIKSTSPSTPVTYNPLENDAVPTGSTISNVNGVTPMVGVEIPVLLNGVQIGTVRLNANNTFTVTPVAGFAGAIKFPYTVTTVAGLLTTNNTVTVPAPAPQFPGGNAIIIKTDPQPLIADLSIVKIGDKVKTAVGETLTYTITATNNGPASAIGAIIQDILPTGYNVSSITCTSTGGSTCPIGITAAQLNAGVVIPTLASGSNVKIVIVGTVTTSSQLFNKAEIKVPAGITDPNPQNNISEFPSIIDPPSGQKIGTYKGQNIIEWKQVWINERSDSAQKATINDDIPAGTTYVPGSLKCEARGNSVTVSCDFDSVKNTTTWIGKIGGDYNNTNEDTAANEVVITFQITIPSDMSEVSNQASITTETGGKNTSDNPVTADKADMTKVVRPAAPITIIKQSDIKEDQISSVNTVRTGGMSNYSILIAILFSLISMVSIKSSLFGKTEE